MLNPYLALRSWSFKNVGDVPWDEHTDRWGTTGHGHVSGGPEEKVHFRITIIIPNTPSSVPMKMSQNQGAVLKNHQVSHGVRQKRVIRCYFFVVENNEQQ